MTEDYELITPVEAAKICKLSKNTLANLRSQGRGPEYRKIGGRIRYVKSMFIAWCEGHKVLRKPNS
ncbi:helix-turn-helix domain-containing protein [bacterium]|nr:helix-turn-helix domain-containing protein [bacterium]